MNKPGMLVVFHPKIVILTTAAITAAMAFAIFARGLGFNGSPETLARSDDALEFYKQTRAMFGDDRVIIVALTTDDVFTPRFLEKLDRLTTRLASVSGVDDTLSLANIKTIRREDDAVTIERLIARPAYSNALDGERLRQLKRSVTADPLYARHYVSTDGRTAAVSVFLKPLEEPDSRAAAKEIERIARVEAADCEILIAGVPVMDERGIHYMLRDMIVCSPIAALLCFLVFLFAFRSFWGAVLPIATLGVGLVWTFGMMSLAGRPVTFATLTLPTVLMAVGSSYLFHVMNQYRISMSRLDPESSSAMRRAAMLDGLKFITPSVVVSGTTTMAGFAALASSSIPTVRDMGLFEAAGVFAMLVLSLAFVPAALEMLPSSALGRNDRKQNARPQKDYATWLNGALRTATALVLFRRRAVIAASLIATALIGIGALRLRVNTDYLRIFPQQSQTVQDAEKLHERLAGAATIQLVVSGGANAALDPDFMRGVDALERFALSRPGVDAALSVADIVKRLNGLLQSPAHNAEEIPQDRARLESIFNDYLSQDAVLSRLVSRDYSRAIIVLKTHLFASNQLRELTGEIDRWSKSNLSPGVSARATGSFVLLNDASDAVAQSQYSSLAIALLTIYFMMVVLFRSLGTALLALIPNLLPIVGFFGFLGWSGIALDITTSLIAAAVLGMAVDNAVHMIRRYRQCEAERGGSSAEDEGWAMWLTMLRTGKPMVLANLMLIAAFLIFLFSSFMPVRTGGLLWALTLLACLAANLLFLPALIKSAPFARTTPTGKRADVDDSVQQPYHDLQNVSE